MGQKVSGELYPSGCIPAGILVESVVIGSSRLVRGPSSKRRRSSSIGDDDYDDYAVGLDAPVLDLLLGARRVVCPDDVGSQLAHSWNPDDRSPSIRIKREDPLTVKRLPVQDTTDAIRTKVGFSRGLHAWTIRWKADQRGSHAVIGVATANAPLRAFGYKCLIGGNGDSWGWDIVKNKLWHNGKSLVGLICPHQQQQQQSGQVTGGQGVERCPSIPDEITVILDMEGGTLGFAVDGQYLGVAFRGLKGKTLHPAISAVWGHCQVSIKYLGSVEPNPLSLSELCRRAIRHRIGKSRLEEGLRTLPLPPLLIQSLR